MVSRLLRVIVRKHEQFVISQIDSIHPLLARRVFAQCEVSYDLTRRVAAVLEYYGSVGPVTGFDLLSQQQHQLFPAIDLNIAPSGN
jgi:hypothetical protein